MTNRIQLRPGLFPVLTNTVLGWSDKLHGNRGNIVMGEGSIAPGTNMLQKLVRQQDIATNWLSIP
jgi:hypothetical protein